MTLPVSFTLTIATIRFLSLLGKALASDGPSSHKIGALAAASRCCERIEHISQYALESMKWEYQAGFLARDVAYMMSILDRFEDEFKLGRNLVPTYVQLNDLRDALASAQAASVTDMEAAD